MPTFVTPSGINLNTLIVYNEGDELIYTLDDYMSIYDNINEALDLLNP